MMPGCTGRVRSEERIVATVLFERMAEQDRGFTIDGEGQGEGVHVTVVVWMR